MATAVAAVALAAAGASTGTAIAVTAAAVVADLAISAAYSKKQQQDAQKKGAKGPRDTTIRSAIAPANIIYGQARVSGPIVYANTVATPQTNDNHTLWMAIALANHACEDITAIWLDGDEIPSSIINWAGTGGVTSGKYGPVSGNQVTNFYRKLGSDGVPTFANGNVTAQGAISELVNTFSDLNLTDHRGRGMTYIASAFELGTATGEGVWKDGAPRNVRAVVKGKKVYDPRKDSTSSAYDSSLGVSTHRITDATTWQWTDNPALCLADYLIDDRIGMGVEGITYSDIDWDMVADAADACDVTVTSPAGNQKRFTCNGVLTTDTVYADNIKAILSSMMGSITWSGGKYRIRAGVYEAPSFTFTENDIVGDIQVQPELSRTQRFNKVRGKFVDPAQDYAETEFIPVSNLTYKTTRDNGLELTSDITLPMTNNEYMAQRIAFKAINLNAQQMTAVIPVNWKGLKVAVGDRISVTVAELGWSSKTFMVEEWSFDPDQGFLLKVKADDSTTYADPALGDYSSRSYGGAITFAEQPVSPPRDLAATSEEEAVLLSWDAPLRPSSYDEVVLYASATSAWSGATEIGRTRGTRFRHEIANGTQRYYWARSVNAQGTESIRNPNSDTSSVTATAGQISTSQLNDDASFAETADWPQITGTGKPDDDATRNVIYQQSSAPTGSINDGDIWIDTNDGYRMYLRAGGSWVDRSDTRIGDAITDIAGLEATVDGKVTTFLQTSAPTAEGVGDLWIDTDDDNKLYRWSGSSWVLVRDSGIAQALTDASNAQATADGKVVTFYQASQPTADGVGDIWFDTDDDNKMYRWSGSSWQLARDGGIAQALADAASAQSTADGKIVTFYQDNQPSSGSIGDLWIDTNDDNKLYRYNGSAWVLARDSGIASAISAATTAQDTADGKVTTFYAASGSPPTAEATGDLWYQTNTRLFLRWSGSSWQQVASYNTGALADLDNITLSYITDAGSLAGLDNITLAKVTDAGALASKSNIDLSFVTDAGSLASLDNITLSYVTDAGTLAGLSQVDTAQIANGAIEGAKIDNNAVIAEKIAANAVVADKIAANAVTAGKIVAGAVIADKIAANAVVADKIAAGAVIADKIGANAVVAGKIAANAVTATEINVSNLAAISANLGSITAGSINASTVTISDLNASNITAGSLNADRLSIDGVTLDTSGGNLIIKTGGVGTTQVGSRAITNSARADMASNTNYSQSWITLVSLTGQSFDAGDIAELSWGIRAHPEASGAPYIAIRVYIRVSNTDKLYQYFIGDVSYDTTNWAQIQQALFNSTFQYSIDTTSSDWRFYLQAATNTNGTFPRTFRAPGTYIQAVRLKR